MIGQFIVYPFSYEINFLSNRILYLNNIPYRVYSRICTQFVILSKAFSDKILLGYKPLIHFWRKFHNKYTNFKMIKM